MKDLIPTIKITNHAGVSSIKDGMKSNAYSKVEREKKPSWIRMTANQVNQNYSLIKNKVKNLTQVRSQHQKIINVKIYAEKINNAWKRIKFKPSSRYELDNLKKYSGLREKIELNSIIIWSQVLEWL